MRQALKSRTEYPLKKVLHIQDRPRAEPLSTRWQSNRHHTWQQNTGSNSDR